MKKKIELPKQKCNWCDEDCFGQNMSGQALLVGRYVHSKCFDAWSKQDKRTKETMAKLNGAFAKIFR